MTSLNQKLSRILPLSMNNESGYTLVLVLSLMTLLVIFFTVMLRDIQMIRILAFREIHRVQAKSLASSGMVKAEFTLNTLASSGSITQEIAEIKDSLPLFGSIKVNSSRFGLFTKMTSIGTRVRTSCTMTALAGRSLPDNCKPVLTLHGKLGGMVLMPGSKIKGTVILSHGKICKGETVQDVREPGLVVQIKDAPTLPFDSSQVIDAVDKLNKEFEAAIVAKDSSAGRQRDVSADSMKSRDTVVINGDYRLERGSYSGKTFVVNGKLTYSDGADCSLCRFLAKSVLIESGRSDKSLFFSVDKMVVAGGKHNSQFIGTDSIVVKETGTFGPMSVWLLRREGMKDSTVSLTFALRTTIQGTIICTSDSVARSYARIASISFGKKCKMSGICMTDGDVDMNDMTVTGRLWVRSIVTSNNNVGYGNYLFNVTLEEENYTEVFPLIGSLSAHIVMEPVSTSFALRKRIGRGSKNATDTTAVESAKPVTGSVKQRAVQP